VRLHVALPRPEFAQGGTSRLQFPELRMADMEPGGVVGAPASPTLSLVVAIPKGATLALTTKVSSFQLGGVQLHPLQPAAITTPPDPDDPLFKLPPFQASKTAYARTTPLPASLVSVRKLPPSGELDLALVRVSGAQSIPGSSRVRVATAVDVSIAFKGATDGKFGSADLLSEFSKPIAAFYASTVVNWQTAFTNLRFVARPLCGEEMMIITSADLRPAADRLAAARTRAGVVSRVFETGVGAGQIGPTPTVIRNAITKEVTANCAVRPTHVLLFGDVGRVPTFKVPPVAVGNKYYSEVPSDLPYTPFSFIVPVGAVGRLPVRTLPQAEAVVDKLARYADAPPADPNFYNRATVASYFQMEDDPASTTQEDAINFIPRAEEVRGRFITAGKTVDRQYFAKPEANPKILADGSSLPASLRRPAFAWNAGPADIAASWNQGRFAIVHIDHGGLDGWSKPLFGRTDEAALTNGELLPYIFSINCLTGAYDNPADLGLDPTAVLDPVGGAVGAFGASIVTWAEKVTQRALLDAIYGGAVSPSQGWVATLARWTMLVTGINTGSKGLQDNSRSWNFFGDPSLPFWANGVPKRFVAGEFTYAVGDKVVTVTANGAEAKGSEVTIVNGAGQALARKTLGAAGTFQLPLDGWAPATGLIAVRAKPGFVSLGQNL
jgi:hypothetical protein